MENKLQVLFDSFSEIIVKLSYDPPKGGRGGWRHATITYGKVKLVRLPFWIERMIKKKSA